jgi:hypothetical protein
MFSFYILLLKIDSPIIKKIEKNIFYIITNTNNGLLDKNKKNNTLLYRDRSL